MEKQKIKKMKDPVERQILESLTFDESLDALLTEVQFSTPIVKDVLKQLIVQDKVAAMVFHEGKNRYVQTSIYDGDNLHLYRFIATAKGIDSL